LNLSKEISEIKNRLHFTKGLKIDFRFGEEPQIDFYAFVISCNVLVSCLWASEKGLKSHVRFGEGLLKYFHGLKMITALNDVRRAFFPAEKTMKMGFFSEKIYCITSN
jgi:hypothetical protein